jgi:hypothetical protein
MQQLLPFEFATVISQSLFSISKIRPESGGAVLAEAPGMASREPVDEERRKAVRQRKRNTAETDPPPSLCPSCRVRGWLLHRTPTTTYFICVNCEHKWHEENRE